MKDDSVNEDDSTGTKKDNLMSVVYNTPLKKLHYMIKIIIHMYNNL